MTKKVEDLKIDMHGLYTIEQAAWLLMELKPDKTFEQAVQMVQDAIASGDLPIAGQFLR